MYGDDVLVIVIDNGFGLCKVGFFGDEFLRVVFFLIIGWFKYKVK